MGKRRLNTEQIIALATLNCCGNALLDKLGVLERITDDEDAEKLHEALKNVQEVVEALVGEEEDPDTAKGIRLRMAGMKVSVGHVHTPPPNTMLVTYDDMDMMLAPLLEQCDIACPCVYYGEDGEWTADLIAIKRCETAKMLRRLLLSEKGIGGECKYMGLL